MIKAQCGLQGCSKPAYAEPLTGITHKYCGRSHAKLAEVVGDCSVCNLAGCREPVAFDATTGRVHDFCSKEHAEEAMRQGQWARPQRELSSNLKLKVAHPCALPGCGLEAYRDGSGLTYDYCGRSHAIEHKQQNAYAAGPSSSSVHRGVKRVGMSEEHTVDLSFIGDEDDQLAVAIALSLKKHHRDSVPEDPDLARAVALSLEQSDRNTCQSCTYLNSDSAMECEMCSSVLRSLVQPRSSRSKPTIDRDMQLMEDYWNAKETEDLIKSSVWTCSTCNTTSDMSVDICGQCLDPKMLPAECVAWPCTTCTFDNASADAVCFMCGSATLAPASSSTANQGGQSECGIPGCVKAASHYGFCSVGHFNMAVDKGIIPPSEKGIEVVFIGGTGDFTAHLLRANHPRHKSVKNQFLQSWKKREDGFPTVERIFWIRVNPTVLESFEESKLRLGNVMRRFHGTSQSATCLFGTVPSKPPCMDPNCRVCAICRTSFDLRHAKRGAGGTAWAGQTQQLRYGEGMYFSPVSSKSNDYNTGSERVRGLTRERRWRCMFLCNVAVGSTFRTTEGFLPKEQCPPPGYNSVTGEVGPHLNYDEVVVYKESQAIPTYLIVYSLDMK